MPGTNKQYPTLAFIYKNGANTPTEESIQSDECVASLVPKKFTRFPKGIKANTLSSKYVCNLAIAIANLEIIFERCKVAPIK